MVVCMVYIMGSAGPAHNLLTALLLHTLLSTMKSPLAVWAGTTPSPFSPPANLLLKDKALSVVPTYGSQGLHGFLGMNNAQAGSARPQASNASEDCLPPLAPTPPLPMPTLPLPLVPLVPMVLAWPKRSGRLTNPPPFRPNSKGSRASNNKVLEAILTVEATVVRTGDSTVVIMDLGPILTGSSKPLRTGHAGCLVER